MPPLLRPRLASGVTMVELLMVIAIVALMATLLIVYLLPSDDDRVEREANRLATYLLGASAEAQMRDGAVRVVYDFADQRYDRQIGHIGARITLAVWEDDPRADAKNIRGGVRLTSVARHSIGAVHEGTGYMNWDASHTEGGVAVLELRDAAWSVVVEPKSGDISVRRGRVDVPEPPPGTLRPPFLADLPPLGEPGQVPVGLPVSDRPVDGHNSGNDGPAVTDDGEAIPDEETGNPTDGDPNGDGDDPDRTDDEGPQIEPEPDLIDDLDAGVPDDASTPDAEVDATTPHTCSHDNDCTEPGYRCRIAVDTRARSCVLDLRGAAYRLREIEVVTPEPPVGTFLQLYLGDAVNGGTFNLIVKFGDLPPGRNGQIEAPRGINGIIVQGVRDGGNTYHQEHELPAFPFSATVDPSGCPASASCLRLEPPSDDNHEKRHPRVDLFYFDSGLDCWSPLSLNVYLRLQLTREFAGGSEMVNIQAFGYVSREAAEVFRLTEQVQREIRNEFKIRVETLYDFLKGSIEPNYSSNDDGHPNAWAINFLGPHQNVLVLGNPYANVNREPSRVCGADLEMPDAAVPETSP